MQNNDYANFGNDGLFETWTVIVIIITMAEAAIGAFVFGAWKIANLFF